MGRFEIYKDAMGQYRFRLIAPNGEIIAVSEAYTQKAGAINGVRAVKTYAAAAPTKDLTV